MTKNAALAACSWPKLKAPCPALAAGISGWKEAKMPVEAAATAAAH